MEVTLLLMHVFCSDFKSLLVCKIFHKTIIVYTDTFTMLTVEALVFKTPKQFQIDMIFFNRENIIPNNKRNVTKNRKFLTCKYPRQKPEKPVSERDGISHGCILK